MTDFQRGMDVLLRIYHAGVRGEPMPKLERVPIRDAQEAYTAGYEDAVDDIAKAHDPEIWRDSPLERFIRNL